MKEESRFQGREALVSPASAYGHPYGRGSTLSDPGKGDIVSGAKARARPAMLYLVAALLFQTVLADALGDAGASSEGGDYPSSFISSYALAQNVVQDDPYALDDIVRSALESAVSRGLVIYNFEPRATKDPDDFPLHKFSIWFFEGSHNLILFCTVLQMGEGPFWYCADPMNFQYHFVEGRLCIISGDDDFNGCYSLTPKNGQIDWLDDHNRYVGTSFTAFFMDTWKQGPDKWGLIREHQEHELSVLNAHKSEIISGLRLMGLLTSDNVDQIDVTVRAAVVAYQRAHGIFPSGFIDIRTFEALMKAGR